MSRLSAWLFGTTSASFLALIVFALGSSSAARGGDVHYFKARVVGTGSAAADYGEDRKQPGLTTAAGVDGQESTQWRWEVRAAAKSVGSGPLVTRATAGRERAVLQASTISYSIQMGVLSEDPLCNADLQGVSPGTTTFVTNDGRGRKASKFGRGEYIQGSDLRISGGQLTASSPSNQFSHTCLHGAPYGHGLHFFDSTSNDARVRRGAFNPRSDRSYSHTYSPPPVNLDRSHSGDPNGAHTFQAQSQLVLQIKAISEHKFDKLVHKYQHAPVGGEEIPYFVPARAR